MLNEFVYICGSFDINEKYRNKLKLPVISGGNLHISRFRSIKFAVLVF